MGLTDKLRHARNKRDRARKHHDSGLVAFFKKRVKALMRRISKKEHKRRKARKHLRTSYSPVAYGTCPVSPIVAKVLGDCAHGIDFVVISGDRRDGVAQRFGKSSQKELYDKWRAGVPGYNPANPPNSSTHEYVNGGNGGTPAFSDVPVGAKLPPFRLGLDLRSNEEASNFCREAAGLGYDVFQPYNSGSELHHVCIRKDPIDNLVKRGWV